MSSSSSASPSFGATLRRLRVDKGLTLRKFALQVGLSPTYVSAVETDIQAPPTAERLVKMSEVLGVSLEDLLEAAGRWDDVAKEAVENRPEVALLFRRVRNLTPDQIEEVTKLAEKLGHEPNE